MGWNGSDLVADFAAELGDTSTAFKTKVLRWANDGIRDIATAHEWPFLRKKGQAIISASSETASLPIAAPTAPTLAALAGGSLIDGTAYYVRLTYWDGTAEVESEAGTVSASITPSGANLSITATIPVSTNPLVTARRIYLKKGSADYFYYGVVSNNTATSTTITADTSSTVTPPDEGYLFKIDGDLYISASRTLVNTTIQDVRFRTNAVIPSGQPTYWAAQDQENILVSPRPTASTTVEFYFFKLPAKIFEASDSQPQIPGWLYDDLRRYVQWRGYEYRDRDGKESKQINYEQGLRLTISRKGSVRKGAGRVRSVTPDSDGCIS